MKLVMSLGCIALLSTPAPVVAQNSADAAARIGRAGTFQPPAPKSAKNAFARVFRAPDTTKSLGSQPSSAAQPTQPQRLTPEIICGLKVWRVDESHDPRMIAHVPEPRVDAKIKRITPEVCQ